MTGMLAVCAATIQAQENKLLETTAASPITAIKQRRENASVRSGTIYNTWR